MQKARRRVVTLLFTDIVDSTGHVARLGDAAWRRLVQRHDDLVRRQLARCGGREIDHAGDGFLLAFDGPGEAIQCVTRILEGTRELAISLRAGVHTGECDVMGDSVKGIAVHIAARIGALAESDQVLVSQTTHDLVAGSEFGFVRHGRHTLRGVPGRWLVYALAGEAVRAPKPPAKRIASKTPARRRSSQAKAARVLVVDDHPLWRETLVNVLRQARLTVVGQADNPADAALLAAEKMPHVVVMDFELAQGDGVEATEAIRAHTEDIRVLFLSASDDRANVVRAIRAGANGYLVKTSRSSDIVEALHRVHRGELVLPPTLAQHVIDELRRAHDEPVADTDPLAKLTRREQETLELMAQGKSNQAICEVMRLNAKTVEGHVSNVFMKLGLLPEPDLHRRVLAVLAYVRARERSQGATPV